MLFFFVAINEANFFLCTHHFTCHMLLFCAPNNGRILAFMLFALLHTLAAAGEKNIAIIVTAIRTDGRWSLVRAFLRRLSIASTHTPHQSRVYFLPDAKNKLPR
jgi:hypothetical protein